MDINPTTMRVKVDHHDIPATDRGMWNGLIATLRTHPGNHCLAAFRGIDGATRPIEGEAVDRFAAAWNLCQGMPLELLTELSKPQSALMTALRSVLYMAKEHVEDIETGLEGHTYDAMDNLNLPQKQAAVAMMSAALQVAPAERQVETTRDAPRGG